MARALEGLRAVADDADGFILDLWGVVHGGERPFPGVVETLRELRTAGKGIAFVTNAPVRRHHVASHLDALGLADCYDALLTSGELTYQHLSDGHAGQRYYAVGPSWAKLLHDELPLERAMTVDAADLVLVVGLEDHRPHPDEYLPELETAQRCGLPLVCANPDRVIVVQSGVYSWCAGALADHYEDLGGDVVWIGKPEPSIFRAAADALAVADPTRIVVVGDGLPTDIRGANQFGARSVLVTRGIHARDLGIAAGDRAEVVAVRALAESHDARPDFVLATLAW
ncbi:MAG: TIGR01459 family HAD-type hydrolase [Pseudomonadota bacterium]